ncbi:Sec-independent protein translocase protein TatB [Plesiomonas sp.]|uniref:Sec-independent protein translocase protein TatB n=1 Tax=Plesiomonas sp. TaxID=2486279 RepID=UPI003F3CD1C7
MFDIGFWELVLIAVIGLVVLGPERLPVAVRTVAHWVRTIRAMAASVQNELNQELKLQEMQNNLKKAEQMNLKDLSPELDASLRELKEAADSVQRPYAPSAESTEPENTAVSSAENTAENATVAATAQPVTSVYPEGSSPAELAEQAEDEHDADDQHPVHLTEGLPASALNQAEPVAVAAPQSTQHLASEQSLKREQP